ncbi:MAG: S9 family peptidase [Acidobacteriia bacterium]|nr:S9 family peptidase [Terriglobia bacterium]
MLANQKFLSFTVTLLLAFPAPGLAQNDSRTPLTVDLIMRGPQFTGYAPQAIRWSGNSQRLYFEWKQASEAIEKDFDTYVVNRDGSGLRKLSEEDAKQAPPVGGHRSLDRKWTVFAERGDIFIYDHSGGQRRQITKTAEAESNPRLTQDNQSITYQRANNLFLFHLNNGLTEQLTDISAPAAPGGPGGQGPRPQSSSEQKKGTASQEFIKKEERDLLETVRLRAQKREEEEAKRKKENARKELTLTGRQSVTAMQLSPDGKLVIASITESAEAAKTAMVPSFVTESAYTEPLSARTKVGETENLSRIALVSGAGSEVKWVDHGLKEAGKDRARGVRLTLPVWSDDGAKAVLQGRSTDNKDRWIFALDEATGKTRILASTHDEAWVGGPDGFSFGWLPDHERVWFLSEKDGYSHLYTVRYSGGEPVQLTAGRWEVRQVELPADKSKFYLTTGEAHAGEDHLYEMSLDGGKRTRLTSKPGGHNVEVSPDGTMLADLYSYTNQPPELFLQARGAESRPVKVTNSPAPEFSSRAWADAPIVEIPARDGTLVPARLYKPSGYRKGGPAVIFVHGAGYLQNAHRRWSSYSREYLFHHLLMERGYMVLDADYRGSAGYGRDWRTAIYRHMGGKDLDDQVDAARWAVNAHGVDPARIGIYGGSYGGFITLMALFTQPDVFRAGAALRPVTDWAHYNHPYTSNILNNPQDDLEAYHRSSPIHHAAGLKGALLICHGMVDINVHFQDTVRLVQKLIELRKENWELAVYPVEDHAFVQPSSWADEYKRILKLFETHLRPGSR